MIDYMTRMTINTLEAKLASTEALKSYLQPDVYATVREQLLTELVNVYKGMQEQPIPSQPRISASVMVKDPQTLCVLKSGVSLDTGKVVGKTLVFDLPEGLL